MPTWRTGNDSHEPESLTMLAYFVIACLTNLIIFVLLNSSCNTEGTLVETSSD